jgi:hypothetical protein
MITVHDLCLTIPAAPTMWIGCVGEHGSIAIRIRLVH